jgi:hypothetical protein
MLEERGRLGGKQQQCCFALLAVAQASLQELPATMGYR